MRMNHAAALLAVPLLIAAAACAPVDETGDEAGDEPSTTATGSPDDEADGSKDACAPGSLTLRNPGQLTVGTDSPAFEPWFSDNDPSNGRGFESAVAFAVAEELGFDKDQVSWVKVPFNNSYAPGAKSFDFDINQISITPQRAKVVDFSDGYYSAAQAVIAPKDSPVAGATSLDELKDLKLGAQTGTTSLTAVRDIIAPSQQPSVFEDTNVAKQSLNNGQVDAIVADLPTAFYITAVEIPGATIVGQFQPTEGETEQFGLLFEKGSELVPCVNDALAALEESGELDSIEQRWLSDVVDVPVLD